MKKVILLILMLLSIHLFAQEQKISENEALSVLFLEKRLIENYNFPHIENNEFFIDTKKLDKNQKHRFVIALRQEKLFEKLIDKKTIAHEKLEFQALLKRQQEEFDDWFERAKKADSTIATILGKDPWEHFDLLLNTSLNIASVVTLTAGQVAKIPKFAVKLSSSKIKAIIKLSDLLTSYEMTAAIELLKTGKFDYTAVKDGLSPKDVTETFRSWGIFLVKTGEELAIPPSQKGKLTMYVASAITEVGASLVSGAMGALFSQADRKEYLDLLYALQEFIPIYGSFYNEYQTASKYFSNPTELQIKLSQEYHLTMELHYLERESFYEKQWETYIDDVVEKVHEYNFPIYFTDITLKDWYYPHITYLAKHDYIDRKNSIFRKNDSISRYELVAILNRIFYPVSSIIFISKKQTHVVGTYDFMVSKIGIVGEINLENFTQQKLTRNEMAEITTKYVLKSLNRDINTIVKSINQIIPNFIHKKFKYTLKNPRVRVENDWNAYSSFLALLGISNGYNDGSYHGQDKIKRAEMAAMLFKALLTKEVLKD